VAMGEVGGGGRERKSGSMPDIRSDDFCGPRVPDERRYVRTRKRADLDPVGRRGRRAQSFPFLSLSTGRRAFPRDSGGGNTRERAI
jgi:hypothetical protein